jgi:hypothetical protein
VNPSQPQSAHETGPVFDLARRRLSQRLTWIEVQLSLLITLVLAKLIFRVSRGRAEVPLSEFS